MARATAFHAFELVPPDDLDQVRRQRVPTISAPIRWHVAGFIRRDTRGRMNPVNAASSLIVERLSIVMNERGVQRMVQAGARPLTTIAYVSELQRDWSPDTVEDMASPFAAHGGGVGQGLRWFCLPQRLAQKVKRVSFFRS